MRSPILNSRSFPAIIALYRFALFLPPGPAIAQNPVFQSDTRIVEIPVVAKDKAGAPVADLRKLDLRVFDNNSAQTILSFDNSDASGPARSRDTAAGNEPSQRTLRTSIILLDAINADSASRIRSRKAISELLRDLPQGRNRIAIFALGDKLHLLHDFSTNTVSLLAAIDAYTGEQSTIAIPDRAPFAGGFSLAAGPVSSTGDSNAELRKYRTLEALTQIAKNMRNVPGEKSLLWLTGGFLPPEDHREMEAAAGELADSKVTLYPIDARGLLSCPPAGCPPEISLNISTMEDLAQQTGGYAYHDDNGISALARAAIEDSRGRYVLTYAPNNYSADGSTHLVLLTTPRHGIDLRYRPAYVAN